MAKSKELQFQRDIVAAMEARGWLRGSGSGYDRERALYIEDFLAYFQQAWPGRWEKYARLNPTKPEERLVQTLARELQRGGTLNVLRHGFKVPGLKVETCSFKPDHEMNPQTLARYEKNRLRVVPELSYSPHARDNYNPRLDLVLFVNGIPTATVELKSEFKQSLELAKRQYRRDRPTKDPVSRRPEPLLTFKRGALVHFAVSQSEVAMTTQLKGADTFFLPFNMGAEDGGAGNPVPAHDGQYATSYLWERLFQPDAWLKVLGRFLHLQEQIEEDFEGRRTKKETMIFPRYHQWDVVNKLIETTRQEGPGRRYLIQHSAGSGKSNSIAWTAHQLASLYGEDNKHVFDSVIVITDRTVLDEQLQKTIYQFEHAEGVVEPITRDGTSQSKTEQLARALSSGKRIIIVTIQTFPALYDALDRYPELASGRYAVIADEAHSSQTGLSAGKLKQILGSDLSEREELSAEELLQAAMEARQPGERISYYAFTATPKAKTIELFGRPPEPTLPPSETNLPEPFHLYSMRQAIEEGFILDVLQNYTTYKTAWKIAHADSADDEVDSKMARIKLARWVRLHPHNIRQKVQVIVEHFRANVAHLLGGQAKGMVVTGSRQEAVRYHLAMSAYIEEQGYEDVHPLVAFSGSVPQDEVIPQEVTEKSRLLNPNLKGRGLAKAFDSPDFNVMIVANKFQTGFDQPKLCAMYVDKKLQGVTCVQTLSRLNRIFGDNKQTFILDFVNEGEEILDAFKPYYNKAELSGVTDPQQIYDLQRKLDDERIYHWKEVEEFAKAFFDPRAAASKLSYYCQPAVDRFARRYEDASKAQRQAKEDKKQAEAVGDTVGVNHAEHALKEAGEQLDRLEVFRKDLMSFVRIYEFVSQVLSYDDLELEQLCVFARNLYGLLRVDRLYDDVDIGELRLTHYRLDKQAEQRLVLDEHDGDGAIHPGSDIGTGKPRDPKKEQLAQIIKALNEVFGAEIHDEDQLHYAQGIANRLIRQDDVRIQAQKHSIDQIMLGGDLPRRILDMVLDDMADHEKLSLEVLETKAKGHAFARAVVQLIQSEMAAA